MTTISDVLAELSANKSNQQPRIYSPMKTPTKRRTTRSSLGAATQRQNLTPGALVWSPPPTGLAHGVPSTAPVTRVGHIFKSTPSKLITSLQMMNVTCGEENTSANMGNIQNNMTNNISVPIDNAKKSKSSSPTTVTTTTTSNIRPLTDTTSPHTRAPPMSSPTSVRAFILSSPTITSPPSTDTTTTTTTSTTQRPAPINVTSPRSVVSPTRAQSPFSCSTPTRSRLQGMRSPESVTSPSGIFSDRFIPQRQSLTTSIQLFQCHDENGVTSPVQTNNPNQALSPPTSATSRIAVPLTLSASLPAPITPTRPPRHTRSHSAVVSPPHTGVTSPSALVPPSTMQTEFNSVLATSLFKDERGTHRRLLSFRKANAPTTTSSSTPTHSRHTSILSLSSAQLSELSSTTTSTNENQHLVDDDVHHIALRSSYQRNTAEPSRRRSTGHRRPISSQPERVLDAPQLVDDYYLNLLDWSIDGLLAVGLGPALYLWNAMNGQITLLCDQSDPHDYITSVKFTDDGTQIAVGNSQRTVQLWDISKSTCLRTLEGHTQRVSCLAWQHGSRNTALTSGGRDALIINYDLRSSSAITSEWSAHDEEICGLAWSLDGTQCASGGNDNRCIIWQRGEQQAKHMLTPHTAAVKALAWCPFQTHLLATGGGTQDRHIRFFNTNTGVMNHAIDTQSQVCSLQWSRTEKELVSAHGFSQNQLTVWKYPSMTPLAHLEGHTSRVLHTAMSPDGSTIVSAAADETLRFWKIWDATDIRHKRHPSAHLFDTTPSRSALHRSIR